jgi:hypothetical protein
LGLEIGENETWAEKLDTASKLLADYFESIFIYKIPLLFPPLQKGDEGGFIVVAPRRYIGIPLQNKIWNYFFRGLEDWMIRFKVKYLIKLII